MVSPGDVISYLDMCRDSGVSLQRGMYFRLKGHTSILLMSRRRDAQYEDQVEDNGKILIYEGHDALHMRGGPDPKAVDQPGVNIRGTATENQLFFQAAELYKTRRAPPERVRIFEKVHRGIWVYNGLFNLVDAWLQQSGSRKVFKFKLELHDDPQAISGEKTDNTEHARLIPPTVKLEVWKRDKGRCAKCAKNDNLHFDHILPY